MDTTAFVPPLFNSLNPITIILTICFLVVLIVLILRFPLLYYFMRTIIGLMFVYYLIKDNFWGRPEFSWIFPSSGVFFVFLLILVGMGISKKNISSFEDLAKKWFELLKWLTIIGVISLATERTHDEILNLILAISYLVVCVYIAFWLLDKIVALDNIYTNYRKNREKTPDQLKKDENDLWKYGITDDETPSIPTLIAFLLSLVAIFFLYSFVNHIVVMLNNSTPTNILH